MIKSQKDFFSGLMFTLVGAGFAWGATNYNVGTGARMGPGYFPLLLGIFLAVLGAFITFYSLVEHTDQRTQDTTRQGVHQVNRRKGYTKA